jgi:hypothetical protein
MKVPKPPAGHAYLLACPFEMLVADGPGPICPIHVENRSVTLYWPFRNAPQPITAPRWIGLSRVPRRPHTEPPHVRAPIPLVTPQPTAGATAADSLRIDVFGPTADSDEDFADQSDLLYNLSKGLFVLTGRDLLSESPESYRQIRLLCRARGSIAHGRLPGVHVGARPLPSLDGFHDMLGGVEKALKWLDDL